MPCERDTGSLQVVVAVATSGRAQLLRECLSSLNAMTAPKGCQVTILVVDNDPSACAGHSAGELAAGELAAGELAAGEPAPGKQAASEPAVKMRYVHEAQPGIPFARNRAIDEAQEQGADVLCFIDDDEHADRNWLAALLDCHARSGAQLVGGPVFVAAPPSGAHSWQRLFNTSLQRRAERKMASTARAARTTRKFTVVTNNWLCDLNWQRSVGLRFDERLQFTGGSDTAFFREAKAAGCRSAWCEAAIVFETQTLDRLSPAYQFRRASAQSLNHFRMKRSRMRPIDFVVTPLTASIKLALGVMLLLVPVYGMASPVIAIRSIGWSHGRIKAMLGGVSTLYEAPGK